METFIKKLMTVMGERIEYTSSLIRSLGKVVTRLIIISVLLTSCYRTKVEYYPNGKIKVSKQLSILPWERDCALYFDTNGIKTDSDCYKEGKLDGEKLNYFSNGKPKIRAVFLKGILEGKYKEYYENGQIRVSTTYHRGNIHGQYYEFYNTGEKRVDGIYNDGSRLKMNYYYSNGSTKVESWYENDKEVCRKIYDSLGVEKEEMRQVRINSNFDTIKVGNRYKALLTLLGPLPIGTVVAQAGIEYPYSGESSNFNFLAVKDDTLAEYSFVPFMGGKIYWGGEFIVSQTGSNLKSYSFFHDSLVVLK